MDKSQTIQDAASDRVLAMNRADAVDELESYLEDCIAHVKNPDRRMLIVRWLETLRNLRAEKSGVPVVVAGAVEKEALDELETALAQQIVHGWGAYGYTRAALADSADRCNRYFEALRDLREPVHAGQEVRG